MNEIKSILDSAVTAHDGPVDPAADVARGRNQLRKRRMTGLGAGAAGLAVIAAVSGVLVTNGQGTGSTGPAAASSASPVTGVDTSGPAGAPATTGATKSSKDVLDRIELVSYTGKQPPGYQVGLVPQGWEIQGVTNLVLVMAPKGFKDQDVNTWTGKIAVMLESQDAAAEEPVTDENLEAWGMTREEFGEQVSSKVTVNGRKGTLTRDKSTNKNLPMVKVSFPDAKGHHVVVQGPLSLGWDDAQWVEFAEGVKVLKGAEAGKG